MPDDLKARLQSLAEASGRSLHAELLARLEDSLTAAEETDERVASLRASLKTTESLLRRTSEGFIALYETAPSPREEGLRHLYVTCRARVSNDPEEIKGLVSELSENDAEGTDYLNRMAENARRRNMRASDRFHVLQSTRGANEKQLAMAKKTEEMAVKIATNLITGEAYLPGNFNDYPLEAWLHGTGHDATAVQDVASRVGPEAERVRAEIRKLRK